jgi:hypothetical protein
MAWVGFKAIRISLAEPLEDSVVAAASSTASLNERVGSCASNAEIGGH